MSLVFIDMYPPASINGEAVRQAAASPGTRSLGGWFVALAVVYLDALRHCTIGTRLSTTAEQDH